MPSILLTGLSTAACVLSLCMLAVGTAVGAPLASPYEHAPTLPAALPQPKFQACRPPPPPVRDLVIPGPYAQGSNYKVIDPVQLELRRERVRALHDYLANMARMSDAAMLAAPVDSQRARLCALRWLDAWAKGGALLGELSKPDGTYERKWGSAALALAYLKLYAGSKPPRPDEQTAGWFKAISDHLRTEYREDARQKNNHFYWAGATAIAVATVLDDRELYSWGVRWIELGLTAVDADGYLPLELLRGAYALHYHVVSLSALTLGVAFMAANGDRPANLPALKRLADRTLAGLTDPAPFAARAKTEQKFAWPLGGQMVAWLEIYARIENDPSLVPWLRAFRPMNSFFFGGDTTAAFGIPIPAEGPRATSPFTKVPPP